MARPCRAFTGFHIHDYVDVGAPLRAVKRSMPLSVILTLICHASTDALRNAAFPLDEPLDAQGLAKAAAAAARIRRVDVAWTSPALRARQTAAALRLVAEVAPELRDLDFGAWSGRTFAEIEAEDPRALAIWTTDCAVAPHGGELVLHLLDRVSIWLSGIGDTEGRIVAVTHAAVARAAIVLALDAKPTAFWRIDIAPLCRIRLRGSSGLWTLLSMND